MALIPDPNWTGPGPGPLIDDGTGPAPGTPGGGGGGRGQFTVEQAAAIDAAAQQAGGNFSGETQNYIDRLAAGAEQCQLLILFLVAHAQMLKTLFKPYCQRMGWVICQISCTVFMLAAK
jgi:hypothetical protein